MLKTRIFFTGLLIWLLLSWNACKPKTSGPDFLASRIQYDVPIMNNDPQLDWWINNLEGSKREPFIDRIMEAVKKGEVQAYDYFSQPISPDQVVASLSDTVYQTLLRTYPPYEEYDTMVIRMIEYRDITKIRFLEEWTWDPKNLSIQKNVIGFGPVVQRKIADNLYNQLLFWILF